jgi:L-ascorbate metabolism protein UlaG (beta-lactamase superfamily)
MRFWRLGHATIIVATDELHCIMDPVLVDPFEGGASSMVPSVSPHIDRIRDDVDLIIISHEHLDHFCVDSLSLLDRESVVIYPEGARGIELALKTLGFEKRRSVRPKQQLNIRDLVLIPTESAASFPEMGMFFRSGDRSLWNMVDSAVTDATINHVLGYMDRLDVALAQYQPVIERPLAVDGLGASFPFDQYARFVDQMLMLEPRCVVPGSCGLGHNAGAWLNHRAFPMTEEQFLRDVIAGNSTIQGRIIPHGGSIEVNGEYVVHEDDFLYVTRTGAERQHVHRWQPHRGATELEDPNWPGFDVEALPGRVERILSEDVMAKAHGPENRLWLQRMQSMMVEWELRVVYPDGSAEDQVLSMKDLRWRPGISSFPKIQTLIAASALVGITDGEIHPYQLVAGLMRSSLRLYRSHPGGLRLDGTLDDEPVHRLLVPGAAHRYLQTRLARATTRT